MTLNKDLMLGGEKPPTQPLHLRAGPLTMTFEPQTVFLRRISLGDVEIIRGVYAAVRDRNWGTVPPRIENLHEDSSSSSFHLTFGVECRQRDMDFFWRGEITGTPDGAVEVTFEGEARSTFLRNRIGLCVLHPLAGCVGRPCEVEHTDGTLERGVFPDWISPHQPFKRIRAVTHEPLPGVRFEVRFDGEVFEMEDQRNWTDASFKTYGTPLEWPFPACIEKGTRIRQSVVLRVLTRVPVVRRVDEDRFVEVQVPARPTLNRPPAGLCLARPQFPFSDATFNRLQALRLPHLRAELHLSREGWRADLRRAVEVVEKLPGCRPHCALFVSDNAVAELDTLSQELGRFGCGPGSRWEPRVGVSLWLVLHVREVATSEQWVRLAKEKLGWYDLEARFAAGTNGNFAELNRHRLAPHSGVLPCFSLNPQVHAFDNLSLVENLEAQPETVATAWGFTRQEVVVSPITLRPRFNAVATVEDVPPSLDELQAQMDPRQRTLFGAAWTLGSLARLSATPHVHSLTYYETTGPLGVMEADRQTSSQDTRPAPPGPVFPLYHLFADLAGYPFTAPTVVSAPLKVAALTVFEPRPLCRVLLANLTAAEQAVHAVTSAGEASVRVMDAANVDTAMREPERFHADGGRRVQTREGRLQVTLSAHAIARIDLVPSGPVD